MAFNHYAKLARIIDDLGYIRIIKINKVTRTKRFDGTYNEYDFYYRLVDFDGNHIKYGKFQDLERLSLYTKISVDELLLYIVE